MTLVRPWRLPLGEDSLTLLYETLRVACFPAGVRYRRRTGCSNGHFDLVPSLTL
ncbi:MAG: hypothetical protein V7K92_25470 [Nostoc sp.]|uniref:hypothetical protein n=1 Tax=Nostoc sp. TaxID=1180 RepID=UPI002FF2280E